MKILSDASIHEVKVEAEGLTSEEDKNIWTQVAPFLSEVYAWISSRKRDMAWLELVRKMDIIRRWVRDEVRPLEEWDRGGSVSLAGRGDEVCLGGE